MDISQLKCMMANDSLSMIFLNFGCIKKYRWRYAIVRVLTRRARK